LVVKHRLQLAIRLGAIALVAVLLWLFIRKIDWRQVGEHLENAKLLPLLIGAALNFVMLFGKALTWRIMLAPKHEVPTTHLVRYTLVAFSASVLAPARAGELLRLWLLKKRDGVPIADSAAVAIAEKLLDALTMLVLVAPLPWLLPDLPAWVTHSILICSAIAVVAFAVLYIAVGRVEVHAQSNWFARLIGGMHVLRSGHRLALSFTTLAVVWIADLLMITLVAYAVGIHLPVEACLLILFTLNLAIMAPSTPAGVGALEVGALAATNLLGIPSEPAFALAVLYHIAQIVPLIVVGLVLEWRLVLGREDVET
jgi:uncharacterized membrane protein YbhN (UPF0104 family)